MVGENVSKHRNFFVRDKGVKVNSCGREGCVGWGKDRERAFCLQCRNEVGLGQRSNKTVVHLGGLSSRWDVQSWFGWRICGGRKNGVDDMDDPVGCCHVWGCDGCISDFHGVVDDGERCIITVQHGDGEAVSKCARGY